MTKFIHTAAFIVIAIMLGSCANDQKAVQSTTEAFLTALVSGDLEKTKTLTTAETQAKWGEFARFVANTMSPAAKSAIASSAISISSIKVDKDMAEVVCSRAIPYLIMETSVLHLKKTGDKWLIHEPDAIVVDRIREEVITLDVNGSTLTDTTKAVK